MGNRDKIIAYDLGTSGIKASLYDAAGRQLADTLSTYDTVYTGKKFHEQDPMQWWEGIRTTTKALLEKSGVAAGEILALSISGHSLGAVPVSAEGEILVDRTPLWSDLRAEREADAFFENVDYRNWYMCTGNGFPRKCYSVFKIMWCRVHQGDVYRRAAKFLGSKDLCNFLMTGRMCTDPSYASGSGVYSLLEGRYVPAYIEAAGIDADKLPEIIPSDGVVGHLTARAAAALGLHEDVQVVCGGVDNSCMALGARGIANNRVYLSLGSSAWIAVIADKPILDFQYKPFVFAHVIPGMYASATSIFAAGTSMRWARENLCPDLVEAERRGEIKDAYVAMNEMTERSPIGAKRLIFNPCLSGGSMIEEDAAITGGFVGLNMGHDRNDLVRAVMEGITYNLRYALEILKRYDPDIHEMLMVGGGSKSPLWRQMFADVMRLDTIKTSIVQDAASLGAAALALKGLGLWPDYSRIDELHAVEARCVPNEANARKYDEMYKAHRAIAHFMAKSGRLLEEMFPDEA